MDRAKLLAAFERSFANPTVAGDPGVCPDVLATPVPAHAQALPEIRRHASLLPWQTLPSGTASSTRDI